MRRILLRLLTSLALLSSAVTAVQTATAAEAESKTEPLTPVVTDAGPHRWVNDGGEYGGRVHDLDIDPANPNVLYACGEGGLYRTTDGAQTWVPFGLPPDHPQARSAVRRVAVCGDTLYFKTARPKGALRSTDAGHSWTPIADEYAISDLLIDPDDPLTLYIVDRLRGVLKSTDGGTAWETLDTAQYAYLGMCPDDPKTLWWSFPYQALLESPDNGTTWDLTYSAIRDISLTGVEHDPNNPGGWRLTLDWQGTKWTLDDKYRLGRADGSGSSGLRVAWTDRRSHKDEPDHLTVVIGKLPDGDGGSPSRGVRITRDGGKTISALELPIDGKHFRTLRIDPDDPDVLYVATWGGDELYYFSSDGGTTWDLLYRGLDNRGHGQDETLALVQKLFHHGLYPEDGSRIVPHPSDDNIVYATSRHAAVLKSEDGGATWSDAGHGITMSNVRSIACHPTKRRAVYVLSEGQFNRVRGGRQWWSAERSPCGILQDTDPVFALTPHPADGDLVVLCAKGSAWLTRDERPTWLEVKHGVQGKPVGCVFDAEDPGRFYILTTGGIVKTLDGGRTWHEQEVASPEKCAGFSRVRQTSAKIIYSAELKKPLLGSTDLGATWEATNLPTTDVRVSPNAVCVHPIEPSHILVLASNGELFRSTDAGRTWERLTLGPRLRCAAFDPRDPTVFYVASDVVYRTRDGGATFVKLRNGLPTADIVQIVVSPADGAVYAATDGAGVCRLDIEQRTNPKADDGN